MSRRALPLLFCTFLLCLVFLGTDAPAAFIRFLSPPLIAESAQPARSVRTLPPIRKISETTSIGRSSPLPPQEDTHLGHFPPTSEPLVDGSRDPGLIPRNIALKVLFETLSVPPNPSAAERARVEVRTARLDLGDEDKEILLRELGTFHLRAATQKAVIESARPSFLASPLALNRFADESAKIGLLAVDAYNALLESLSPEGAARLEQHLEYIRTRMKIYPTPDMSNGLTQ